jgi:hypothetical protein
VCGLARLRLPPKYRFDVEFQVASCAPVFGGYSSLVLAKAAPTAIWGAHTPASADASSCDVGAPMGERRGTLPARARPGSSVDLPQVYGATAAWVSLPGTGLAAQSAHRGCGAPNLTSSMLKRRLPIVDQAALRS